MNDITYCAECANYECQYNILNAFKDEDIKAVWCVEYEIYCKDYIRGKRMKLLVDETTLKQLREHCKNEHKYYYAGIENAISFITNESNVRDEVNLGHYKNQYEDVYRCGHCNLDFHRYGKMNYKYCPRCGSKFIGVTELK